MPFYRVTDGNLAKQDPTTFRELSIFERTDIQRLLLADISPLGDDILVIAEEFGQWVDAHRRIDIPSIDRQGRLVVVELKRTEDGGHMELQAPRYAAMVSSMDFAKFSQHSKYIGSKHPGTPDISPRRGLHEGASLVCVSAS
jgi:hypothetical protein